MSISTNWATNTATTAATKTAATAAKIMATTLGLCLITVWAVPMQAAGPQPIDAAKSRMQVRVYKTGLLSALGHDHTIEAPIAGGSFNEADGAVNLRVGSATLKVVDEHISETDRAEIQKTMLGTSVLDVEKYPEVEFRSTHGDKTAKGWLISGSLTLHGQTKPVKVQAKEESGHFVGWVAIKQTEFGIAPVSVAGGSVKVKDEVRIEFDIVGAGATVRP